MNRLISFFDRFIPGPRPIPAGIYHYQSPAGETGNLRLHLRINPSGEGLLVINASTVLHLNNTAAEFAYYFIQKGQPLAIARQVSRRYNIKQEEALRDYQEFDEKLKTLLNTPDLDPITFLDFDRRDPYTSDLTAPYRLDCALTYRLESSVPGELAPLERVKRELVTEEWHTILQKAWDAGIPHIVFTGGEPTLRPDLPELIAFAEKLGLVTGVLTTGGRISETGYLHALLQSGLDHIMIILDPESDIAWEAVRDVVAEDIAVTVHVTLTEQAAREIVPLLDYLVRLGVKQISFSTNEPTMRDFIKVAKDLAAERNLKLVWDIPVPYSEFHPLAFELADYNVEPPAGAGKAWLYVEPDGDVLPAQGVTEVLGNLLTQPWDQIWANRPQPAD